MSGLEWLRLEAGGLAAVVGAAVLWLLYFDVKDSFQREPRMHLLAAFGLGMLAALLGLGVFVGIERFGFPRTPGPTTEDILFYFALGVGPIEEGCKFLVARAIVFRWRAFDEKIDGLVYAATLGIGFATAENLLYLPYLEGPAQLARAATSPLTHALFASIWGFGVSRAFFVASSRVSRFLWQAIPLAMSMLLHGLYDAVLVAWGATYIASGTILAIWVYVL